jgi:sortase A
MMGDAWLYQRRAWHQALEASSVRLQLGPSHAGAVDRAESARVAGPEVPATPPPGSPIGRLTIPRLGLEAVVAEGTSTLVLQRAIGHLTGTAEPGGRDNVVLAGHRDTFFRPLEGIRNGDLIEIENHDGVRRYSVEWTQVVDPQRVDVAMTSGYPSLTLVTCYPFRFLGTAPFRFVVRARAIEEEDGGGAEAARLLLR